MPTDKGKCPHGEFILTEGCPQCMAEKQAESTIRRDIYQPFAWHWENMYKLASQHPGVSLDEMISILDHQYSGRVP